MSNRKENTVIAITLIALALSSFSVGYNVSSISNIPSIDKTQSSEILKNVTDIQQCVNQTLINTSQCLIDNLKTWYIYNLSNTGKTLSESDFMALGGVCSHASEWYVEKMQSLGFEATTVSFFGDIEFGHQIALVYEKNMTGYCILDQRHLVGCMDLFPTPTQPKDLNSSIV